MTVRLGVNIASLQAQRRLGEHTRDLSKISERLSSGQRINHAGDDAAGLSVASNLQVDSRVLAASIRNINDGISAISIVEGALENLSTIVTRLAELAEQASNGVYSSPQRAALDKEAQALAAEYGRIAEVTGFNGVNLLNGGTSSLDLQVGIDSSVNSRLSVAMPSASRRNVGNGTFSSSGTYSAPGDPQSITSGDINNDGINDLMVPNSSGVVLTYLGNGDGSFKSTTSYAIPGGSGGNAAELRDLDNDGDLDMLTLNSLVDYMVRLNDGTGSFGATMVFASGGGGGAFQTRLADMNGDGTLDILSALNATGTLRVSTEMGTVHFSRRRQRISRQAYILSQQAM